MTYFGDVAALARKDLLLELRAEGDAAVDAALRRRVARDLPFRAAARQRATSRRSGCCGSRSSSPRSWRSRARSWPSASRASSTRSCWRRATAARSGSARRWRCSSSSLRRGRRAAGVRGVLLRCRRDRPSAAVALADVGIAAVGTLLGAMAVAGRARELLLPLLFLPLAIPVIVGGVGASAGAGARYLLVPAFCTTRCSRCSPGRRSSTSSPRPESPGLRWSVLRAIVPDRVAERGACSRVGLIRRRSR